MNRLPPLNSLRAFEAAGRHLSFTRAAAELHVTAGAISQQIRVLEEFLETRLFKRLNRAIVLTDAGQLFLPLISSGFEHFSEAVGVVRGRRSEGPLTITSAPSFVSKWLIPRLASFKSRHPGIDVRIDTSDRLVDFVHEDIDVGIRFGDGVYPDLETVYLFSFDLIPVCSPSLLAQGDGLRRVSDLKNYTLLHSNYDELDPGFPDWSMWLKVVEADDVDARHGIYFNQSDLLFQAALDGQGVALLANVMAEPEIEAGRLLQPFAARLPVKLDYHLVTSPQKAQISKVVAFRDWILSESAYLRNGSDQARGS
ncbi:MAG: transcriptional regulator GcvA [Gammaproteobacteria bacterium]|nr:transcriptional regulator GcvA [Gammaproteobacteria bacterium]